MIQILLFFCYSFLGWCCECVYCSIPAKKFINRGFLEGPYCPIYGVGALLVISLLLPYKQHPVTLFIAGTILVTTLEYITSWLMEIMFHTRWWDYSNYRFNINGRVCLLNAILFGIMALVVCYGIHPVILDLLQKLIHCCVKTDTYTAMDHRQLVKYWFSCRPCHNNICTSSKKCRFQSSRDKHSYTSYFI